MCRPVFLSWLQFVQCLCILFLYFYLTVLIACMICFYYNVCDCHAFIKGNLLTYLLTYIYYSQMLLRPHFCCLWSSASYGVHGLLYCGHIQYALEEQYSAIYEKYYTITYYTMFFVLLVLPVVSTCNAEHCTVCILQVAVSALPCCLTVVIIVSSAVLLIALYNLSKLWISKQIINCPGFSFRDVARHGLGGLQPPPPPTN